MDKEQRAKEREKERERAFYLLSSLSISFVKVLLCGGVLFCNLLLLLNANDAVFVTQRTTTVDDEVIYYCRRRRLRRRRFFFVFFFFARRESKEGKEIRIFLSLCYPSSFSLLSFSVAKSNFIIASFGLRLLKKF